MNIESLSAATSDGKGDGGVQVSAPVCEGDAQRSHCAQRRREYSRRPAATFVSRQRTT